MFQAGAKMGATAKKGVSAKKGVGAKKIAGLKKGVAAGATSKQAMVMWPPFKEV